MSTVALLRTGGILVVFFLAAVGGCQRSASPQNQADDVKVDFAFQHSPPAVGPAAATVRLTDKDGKPIEGAAVKLEGNMNHAGMKPVFADAKETRPGQYEASLELTMGGDWFILINATLADGRKLSRKVDVPGVRSE
jgi:hypothetical protein